jgi:hypothetical protein
MNKPIEPDITSSSQNIQTSLCLKKFQKKLQQYNNKILKDKLEKYDIPNFSFSNSNELLLDSDTELELSAQKSNLEPTENKNCVGVENSSNSGVVSEKNSSLTLLKRKLKMSFNFEKFKCVIR